MNILQYIGSLLFSGLLATGISLTVSIVSLIILAWIVNWLRLNNHNHTYWVFNICLVNFWISWILSFAYFMAPHNIEPSKPARLNKSYRKPLHYVSTKVSGTVESTHIWGRTEVVPVTQVKLTQYFYGEDPIWELSGSGTNNGIIQPQGRKDYFIPVISGTLDIEFGSAQLIETSNVGYGNNESEYWNEFRVANLIFKDDKPVSLLYKHYNYQNGIWKEIAGYEAIFEKINNENN